MPPARRTALSYRIGTLLAERAADLGVSQTELAQQVGISQSQVSKLFRGAAAFDVDLLDSICTALGVEPGVVFAEAKATE